MKRYCSSFVYRNGTPYSATSSKPRCGSKHWHPFWASLNQPRVCTYSTVILRRCPGRCRTPVSTKLKKLFAGLTAYSYTAFEESRKLKSVSQTEEMISTVKLWLKVWSTFKLVSSSHSCKHIDYRFWRLAMICAGRNNALFCHAQST